MNHPVRSIDAIAIVLFVLGLTTFIALHSYLLIGSNTETASLFQFVWVVLILIAFVGWRV
jgi:hypothetical protein